jgi:hypothetical protein
VHITAKKRWLISTMVILFTLSIAVTSVILIKVNARAAGPTHHNPLLNATVSTVTHKSLTTNANTTSVVARYNALLNSTADQGDIADPAAAPPALCATYTKNPYARTFPNVDMINGDTTVTVGTQAGCKAAQNETTIAVNPRNPFNIVAGTNDYRVYNLRENRNDGSGWAYTTKDGGRTWTDVQLPHLTFQTGATGALSDMDSAGDPSISFGPNNTVYYANLVFSRLNTGSGIVVSISHDGGLTWGEPSIVHLDGVDAAGNPLPTNIANDKEWVAVDPRNSQIAYVTWTTFLSDDAGNDIGSPIVISSTHDGGATWSAPTQVTPAFTAGGITPYNQGSIPVVDRNGILYVAYEGAICQDLTCSAATDHDEVIVAKSINGGKAFTNALVDVDYDFPVNPHVGREALTGENFRINSFPQLTIDRITNVLYITWADDRNGQYDANGNSVKTNGDALLVSSATGTVWNNEITVGSTADEVFPAVAAFAGRVMVSFYTRAYNPAGINLDYAFSSVLGIGPHLQASRPIRITEQSENPQVQFVAQDLVDPNNYLQGVFIGDYTAVAVGPNGVFHPCWTDFRGNPGVTLPNQDAYTQSI